MRALPIVMLIAASAAQAQINPHVTLRVTDSTGQPVPFVNVVRGSSASLVADDSGRIIFTPGRGKQQLELRRIGFQPLKVIVSIDHDTTLIFALAPAARLLPAQRVVASHSDRLMRSGLYDRIRDVQNGLFVGTFITAEEIEMRAPVKITQMFDKAPGLTVSKGVPMSSANNCSMTVYLDGARIDFGDHAGASMAEGSPGSMWSMINAMNHASDANRKDINENRDSMNGMIRPDEVAAIEIYPLPGSLPAIYQHLNGTCGVIAIWTR